MRIPWLAVALLCGAGLSGCLGDGQPDVAPAPGTDLVPIPAFPIELDHDHADPLLHQGAANLESLGYHSGYGHGKASHIPSGQGFSELFVRDGLAFLGRRGGDDGGFLIFDVNDPAGPLLLGAFPGLANYDMESTHDNAYVFFVSQFLNNQQPTSLPPDDPGELPRGIHVVDIHDRADPQEAFFFPVPTRGVHTLTYHRTDAGRELVAAQTYDFAPDPSLGLPVPGMGANPVAQRVLLFDFVREPAPHLVLLSSYEKRELPPLPNEWFPHDVAIQKHPLTSQLIMYVAYWDLGAFLVDITDPTNPTDLAQLADFSPSQIRAVHLAAPANDLIDGRHVTVTEPELGGGEPETGQYTLFDTTDPQRPVRLGHWTLPGELANDQGTRFSPHNFEAEDGYLYLAHYHAGVWVVDVHDERHLQQPQAVAYAQPLADRPGYAGDIPDVWTVLHDDGYVYASDIATGLHVLRFAGHAPEPAHDHA